jgi:hypothetical protein
MSLIRRTRGLVLRLVRRRGPSLVAGLLLAVPAIWIQSRGRFDAWWVEGLSLVALATGIALLWSGMFGVKPDWTE